MVLKATLNTIALVIPLALSSIAVAQTRTWTSGNGAYTLKADLIAFNDDTIVLKKDSGDLVAVELKELSDDDRKFVEEYEASDEPKSADKMQTWTGVDGTKIKGRVIKYGKREVPVQRKRGKVYIEDEEFGEKSPLQQKVVLKVISKLEGKEIEDEKQLIEWAKSLRSEAKVYPLEGVLLELESGDEIALPFFMFSKKDLAVLEPGWKLWLQENQRNESSDYEDLMVRAQAMAYQADRQAQRQIEMLKLELLATASGITSIWQVSLFPARGVVGRPMAVMVSARDSQTAKVQAMQRYPGYIAGRVQKMNR